MSFETLPAKPRKDLKSEKLAIAVGIETARKIDAISARATAERGGRYSRREIVDWLADTECARLGLSLAASPTVT